MKKRIFRSMLLLSSISLILCSAALCFVFYSQFSSEVKNEMRNRAESFIGNSYETAATTIYSIKNSDIRVTAVAPDGTVVFDNVAQASLMSSHSSREEIADAFETGSGQSKRFSDTLRSETVYYAIRLTDGYVLRVAKTSSSIFGLFFGALPVVVGIILVMIIVGYLLAGNLTQRIVAPINRVDLESGLTPPYDELAPFIKIIAGQREYLARQLSDLQNRSDTISTIMSNMNEGIILINEQGLILSANRSVLRIFDKEGPVDGNNILEFLRDITFSRHVRGALGGRAGEMDMELTGRAYRVYFSHVASGGAIVLFLDVTEKAKSEKYRREFSANVSHELKTPLTSIYGNAEMLCGGIVAESDRQAFYSQIKDEAGRLIALIEDIMTISRLDEGSGQEMQADVELTAIAAEAVRALSLKAAENAVTLRCSGGGIVMKANRSLIYEMFYNLIDNAIKYNKPGGSVEVGIAKQGDQIRITVADTGIGIPKEEQGRVFERFFRVDRSRSKKTGGTGLGLAIVKHIVLTHGGKIELQSKQDKGTTVVVMFYPEAK